MATVVVDSSVTEGFEPDIIHVTIYLSGEANTRTKAADNYNKSLKSLYSSLEEVGISRDLIKNQYMDISNKYDNKKIVGFEYYARYEFDIPSDNGHFRDVWRAVFNLGSAASASFSYDLKDHEGAREKILRKAVSLGHMRAENLADAVDCDLGEIVRVQNSLNGSDAYDGMVFREEPSGDGSVAPEFNPEKVEIECSVLLEYELKHR